ncbi:MAG: galactose-1-phosphate uridylyltransferase [Thermoproteota archaeon]
MEVRTDWFSGRKCIIVTERGKRPDYFNRISETEKKICPFCPGNEKMTPKAEIIIKVKDSGELETKYGKEIEYAGGWQARVFRNLYPAFDIVSNEANYPYGYHYLIVETKEHDKDISDFSDLELKAYTQAIISTKEMIEKDEKIRYVAIFKNYGKEAGASVPHSHTQVIGSALVPPNIKREQEIFSKKEDAMSLLIEEARNQRRVVVEKDGLVVFTPYVPISPYELWITSREKENDITKQSEKLFGLSRLIRAIIRTMKKNFGYVSYNFYFHIAPKEEEKFHWHMEIVPRVNVYAGYELGFGIVIITADPENVATFYSDSIKENFEQL